MNELELLLGDPSGMVPPVDPSDIKNVWAMGCEHAKNGPNEQRAIGPNIYARVCVPGANVFAVWHRVAMLNLVAEHAALLKLAELPDDVRDAVFNVAAKCPLKQWKPGEVHEGLPADVQEFAQQIQNEVRRLGPLGH